MAVRANTWGAQCGILAFLSVVVVVVAIKITPVFKPKGSTSNEELDPTSRHNLFLEGLALRVQISGVAVQNVSVFRLYVDVLEEVVPHEGVVALGVIPGKTCAGVGVFLRHSVISGRRNCFRK